MLLNRPYFRAIPLRAHVVWFLTTVMTFVIGSQLARRGDARGSIAASHDDVSGRYLELSETLPGRENTHLRLAEEGIKGVPDGDSIISSARKTTATTPSSAKKVLPLLTKEQIEELAYTATKSREPLERRKAFDRLLQEMESDSFTVEQAMMMRSSLHENGADGEQWRAFDYAWGANDPQAALAHIDDISEKHRNGFTSNMLPGLASVEPQMAIDLVSGMEGRQQHHMTGRVIEGLADYDIHFATDYVNQLAENGTRGADQQMKRLASEVLSTAGFEDGRAWAEDLDPGALQGNALRRVANDYANTDPNAAADWAEQFVGQDQNSRLFGEIVREWGDVAAATEWVNSLEPSLAQRDALSAVYGFLGSQQPHEAVQEIINMPASENKDFAINGFISGLAHQDGEAAVTWAAEIASPGMREAAMIRAGTQFFQQDQQAATDWFQASGLPETALNTMTRSK